MGQVATIEQVIARIERGTRMKGPDGSLTGYILEVDEWREIRQALRSAVVRHMDFPADPCWCGVTHWDPGS